MNAEIKTYAKAKRVKQWQIADKLGIQESKLSKMLRYELPEDEQLRIMEIIDEIAKETHGGVNV